MTSDLTKSKLDALEKLADAATTESRLYDFETAANPQTVKQLIALVRQCKDALTEQHSSQTRYSQAQKRANLTCGEFKSDSLSGLIESGYMQGIGKRTAEALAAIETFEKKQ